MAVRRGRRRHRCPHVPPPANRGPGRGRRPRRVRPCAGRGAAPGAGRHGTRADCLGHRQPQSGVDRRLRSPSRVCGRAARRLVAPMVARQAPFGTREHDNALTIMRGRAESGMFSPEFRGGLMTNTFRIPMLALAATVCLTMAPAARAASDDQPWVLDANNWQEGKDLLPDPVLKRLKDGQYWFKVVPVDPQKFKDNYSKKFWDATAANEGKYDIEAKNCGLKDKATGKIPDFVYGLPFPKVDKSDPLAACKIAQNFQFAGAQGGGGGATFTLNGVDTNGEFRRVKAFIHSMGYQGRSDGKIESNPDNLFGQGIGGAIEPQDVEGVSTLTKRYWDWDSQDAILAPAPSPRRARRINAASRSDPVAGMDIFADDLNCYAGKVEYYQWKLVGEGQVLAPLLSPDPFPMKPSD